MTEDTALIIEMLKAGFGDCLLVRAPTPAGEYRVLIDTGPHAATYGRLRDRLLQIPHDADGSRHLDLFIVTHIDHDHIGNVERLLRDEDLALAFGDIWFNGFAQLPPDDARGTVEADAVSVAIKELGLPLNRAFCGQAVVAPAPSGYFSVPAAPGAPQLTVLSPTVAELVDLAAEWKPTRDRFAAGRGDSDLERGRAKIRPLIDLATLFAVEYDEDDRAPNRSSIVVLIEHRGARAVLTGDGVPGVFGRGLARLSEDRRRRTGRIRPIDALKVSHHGSRANTNAAVAAFGAEHYLISTDNKMYQHPDDETLARLIVASPVPPTFWFNHHTPANQRWAEARLQTQDHPFEVRFARGDEPGITVHLRARG